MRYIVIWRRSPSARYLDVQLDKDDKIAVFDQDEAQGTPMPVITDEAELVAYVNGEDTETRRVSAELAHSVLGWSIS